MGNTSTYIQVPSLLRLSGSCLKLLAVVSMVIDHVALYFVEHGTPLYEAMRCFGRIAFPIFAFLVAEGYAHSRDRLWYFLKLLGLAFISEAPWYLLNGADGTHNVLFTLSLGVLAIGSFEQLKQDKYLCISVILALCTIAALIGTDYDWRGVLMIILFYLFRQQPLFQVLFSLPLMTHYGLTGAVLASTTLLFYDGTRGFAKGRIAKYYFYLFYPAHLLAIFFYLRALFYL